MSASVIGDERLIRPNEFVRKVNSTFGVHFDIQTAGEEPFFAAIRPISSGRLKTAQLAFSAHRTTRSGSLGGSQCEYFLINRLDEGAVTVYQDGRQAQVEKGDFYLINTARDFTFECEAMCVSSLYVDAKMFRAVYPEVDYCTAIPISGRHGAGKTAVDFISSIFEIAGDLESEVAERMADAIPSVIAVALAARPEKSIPDASLTFLFHKERVKAFARSKLSDSTLSCEMIANALKVSQRFVYDIFSDEPLTLMRWVWAERLERCRRELEMPALKNRMVSEIAFSWGFSDLAHFSRSFSAAFGRSPRAYRNEMLGRLRA